MTSPLALAFLAMGVAHAADTSSYNGRWRPDQEANTRLAIAANPAPTGDSSGSSNSESRFRGQDGDHTGKPGETKSGGGDRADSKAGEDKTGGSSSNSRRSPDEPTFIEDPIATLAAPQSADLLLDQKGDEVVLGTDGRSPLELKVDGAAQLLNDGRTRARLYHSGSDLILEINGDDGLKVTQTYRLEGDGKRLRIMSVTQHPSLGKPQEIQRLYRRPTTDSTGI